jgi:hypothetical protein
MTGVRPQCVGEHCTMCGAQAVFKVAEELQFDEPSYRHPYTAYVCGSCFRRIMRLGNDEKPSIGERVRELLGSEQITVGPVMRAVLDAFDKFEEEINARLSRLEKRK